MQHVSLQAAITLTELSERTIRRRLVDGSLKYAADNEAHYKTRICFDSIKSDLCIALDPDDIELIKRADAGNANAQNDLGLLFLEKNKPKSAIYWLELATKQDFADAMHLLGHCYLEGNGLPKNYCLAIMWIAKAAALGHPIALEQIQSIQLKG
ncbi:MAG: sel1 repeat family protein [Methylobacter sp.]|nr:MAG: sel1 repeat family protein [Methylobacter sp.]